MALLVVAAPSARPDKLQILRKILNWKPLVLVGTFFYSFYLLHTPLLQILWPYGLRPLNLAPDQQLTVLCGAGIPVIICVSYLFHLACERPFMRPPKMQKPLAGELGLALTPE